MEELKTIQTEPPSKKSNFFMLHEIMHGHKNNRRKNESKLLSNNGLYAQQKLKK